MENNKLESLSLTNDDLDILAFVRKCNDEGDPLQDTDLSSMGEAFGLTFKNLWEYDYIDWQEVGDEMWFYLTSKGMAALALNAGQLPLPMLDSTLIQLPHAVVLGETMGFGIQVLSLIDPVECPVCHRVEAYDKERAGYPNMLHCTSCGSWVNTEIAK